MSGSHLSKEFFDLVKSIGESRSKQEEDKIVMREVQTLKQAMAAPDVPSTKMKEYLIRMIYVEMLGHDASFGHIHAVKMVSRKNLLEKRVGYLSVQLTLHQNHSFMLLLVNSLQTDLRSDNFLEVSMALGVVCRLVNEETIPALQGLVVNLLEHPQANVRKKAVMALHRFHQIDSSTISSLYDKVRKVLCDKDPCVMAASLCLLHDLCLKEASLFKDLVPSFVSILKQVTEHRLPREFDYHRMPAPWIQLKLLQILSVLGNADKKASEGMYEILHEVMKRADIGINVGYAIVYECVRTVTSIYPDNALIEDAAQSISRFITSDNHNLKYLGVNSLASIVQINPKYAAEHQLTVIDCLEDPDETLKRKTLDLLYSMTNPQNVVVIVDKLTNYLRSTTDIYLRTELVSRINQLAEKYAPNNGWYIQTMNNVFELGGDIVRPEMAHSVMRLIAEQGASGDGGEDMRVYAVNTYVELLHAKKTLPDIMLKVIAWVLGEFGHLHREGRAHAALLLCQVMDRQYDDASTRSWVVSALMKLCAHMDGNLPKEVREVAFRYEKSLMIDLQQRAHEFIELAKSPSIMKSVLPLESSVADMDVDEGLSFLNSYVDRALSEGKKPYQTRAQLEVAIEADSARRAMRPKTDKALKMAAYPSHAPTTVADDKVNPFPSQVTAQPDIYTQTQDGGGSGLKLEGVAKKWGRSGFKGGADEEVKPADSMRDRSDSSRERSDSQDQHMGPTSVPNGSSSSASSSSHHPHHGSNRAGSHERERPVHAAPVKELTEREKAAMALFSGVAGGGAAAAANNTAGRRGTTGAGPVAASTGGQPLRTPPPAHPAPAPGSASRPQEQPKKPVQSAPIDLLSFDSVSESPAVDMFGGMQQQSAVHAAPVQAAPVQPPVKRDLLDMFSDMTAPSATPAAATPAQGGVGGFNMNFAAAAAPAPAVTGGGGGFDMFGGMTGTTAPAPQQQAPQQQAQPKVSAFDAAFAGLMNADEKESAPSLGGGSVAFGASAMDDTVAKRLASLPKSHQSDQMVVMDASVQVTHYKAYAADRTLLCLFVSNKRGMDLKNFTVAIDVPKGMFLAFDPSTATAATGQAGITTSSPVGKPSTHNLVLPVLPANSTTTLLLSVQCTDASAASSAQIGLTGVLSVANVFTHKITINFDLKDLLRPANMNTQQYGNYWKQYTQESKIQVRPTSCATATDFMARMKTTNLFPVQTIGQENIVSGCLVGPSTTPIFCFVHGKVQPGPSLGVIVRTQSQDFTRSLSSALSVYLK